MIEYYGGDRWGDGEYLLWLESLQPGDKWKSVKYHHYSSWAEVKTLEVEKLTKTQIVLTNGARYRRDSGRMVGGSMFDLLPSPSTTKAIEGVASERRRLNLARELEAFPWRKQPLQLLEAAFNILKEVKDDTEHQP